MIKIIKQGNPKRKIKYIYEYECFLCGCIFEFEFEDLESDFCFGDTVIKCPCCHKDIGVVLDNLKSKLVEIEENKND